MSRLTDHQRGVLSSAMSDASCALLLARSEAWVRRTRVVMAGASRADEAEEIEVLPATSGPVALTALEQRRPAVIPFVRRFHKAGWTLGEISRLFDVDAEELAEVLL